jgi:hypothetical protein
VLFQSGMSRSFLRRRAKTAEHHVRLVAEECGLIELGDTEICKTYPGLDEDLYVAAEAEAFVKWHAGQLTWAQATRHRS